MGRNIIWAASMLGLLPGVMAPLSVAAHAIVVTASPAARSTVGAGDLPVVLEFNSRIDRSRSRLSLIDARGTATKLALQDSPDDRMQALARAVQPGVYRLEWYVLSIDGHITRGNVKFAVGSTGR